MNEKKQSTAPLIGIVVAAIAVMAVVGLAVLCVLGAVVWLVGVG